MLDGITAGAVAANKAVVAGANRDVATIRNLTIDGTLTAPQTGAALATATNRIKKLVKVTLAAADTGGGIFSWANPEATAIIVTRVLLDVTTQSSGACTVDVGMTAVSAATAADNLINGLSLAAPGLFDNLEEAGTNGTSRQKVAVGKWVTASMASGASAGLVGSAYIEYFLV
jgi:hypothetical protein